MKVPEPNAPHYMASTLAAPARSKSAKESASSALSASGDPVARPGSLVPAEGLDPSPSASGAPSSGGRTGLERMPSAGDEKAVGVTVERTGSAVPANLTSGTDTKAQRVPVTGPRVNGTGSEGAGAAGGPLIFVRTAGERPAAWNPTARFIGAQSVHSILETRAPTSTTADVAPVMALPETPIPGMAIPAIVTQGDPDTHYADSAHMTADVSPKPQRALPDLESAGRAADGFALFLLDERASTSRRAPGLEPALRPSPTVTALPQPASPRRESLPAALSAAAPLPAIALTDDAHEPAGSLAVLPEDVAYGAITAMSVSAHPLADWMTDLDDALRGRWIYPPDLRALGVEGTVEVSFNVLPNGRITDVGVTRADADPALVFAALASLPPSVTAPPPGWGRLGIRYTYRYRAGG
ncbi:MAG: TonB family protein [Myxococcales bacterium]|nr:TonB family protein [Myxococcales bacterium]